MTCECSIGQMSECYVIECAYSAVICGAGMSCVRKALQANAITVIGDTMTDEPKLLEGARKQSPHHLPDEPKARVLALSAEGYSNGNISALTAIPARTVRRWVKRGREVACNEEHPLMMQDWYRIIRRSQGMMHSTLDISEEYAEYAQSEGTHPLAVISRAVAQQLVMKGASTYNFFAGTGSDKVLKDSQPTTVQAKNVLIVLNAERPEVVDAIEVETNDA